MVNIITSALLLPKKQPVGTMQVYYFDVEQGDSTLIRTPKDQYILINGEIITGVAES